MATPAQFYDQNGELRLDGSLVGGGGSQPFSGVSLRLLADVTGLVVDAGPLDITWTVADYDTDGYITVPGTTLVVPSDGIYALTLNLSAFDDANAGGDLQAAVAWGVPSVVNPIATSGVLPGDFPGASLTDQLSLAAGQNVVAYSSFKAGPGGTTYNLDHGACRLTITRLGSLT